VVQPRLGAGVRELAPLEGLAGVLRVELIGAGLRALEQRVDPRLPLQMRISANVTGDFGNVTDLRLGAGLRG
jgi:hypothetical protein